MMGALNAIVSAVAPTKMARKTVSPMAKPGFRAGGK
jgi:hypothetical protein